MTRERSATDEQPSSVTKCMQDLATAGSERQGWQQLYRQQHEQLQSLRSAWSVAAALIASAPQHPASVAPAIRLRPRSVQAIGMLLVDRRSLLGAQAQSTRGALVCVKTWMNSWRTSRGTHGLQLLCVFGVVRRAVLRRTICYAISTTPRCDGDVASMGVVMAAGLERPNMAERVKLPQSCRRGAQKLPNSCAGSRGSA